jgi:hypothetical protein
MARPVLAIGIAMIGVEGKSDGGNRAIGVTSDYSALRTLQLETNSGDVTVGPGPHDPRARPGRSAPSGHGPAGPGQRGAVVAELLTGRRAAGGLHPLGGPAGPWAKPDGPKVSLNLTRLPASEPAARIGSLVTNPGGPGGWGSGVVAYGGLGLSTPEFAEVRQHFDVIGMDPRGVGLSAPRITRDPAKLYDPTVNRFPADQASYARSVVHNRAAEQECLDRTVGRRRTRQGPR